MFERGPFRADHVGSYLRPERLIQGRARFAAGELDPAALRQLEDECIREVVAKQEAIGLRAVTDGEFRRTYFHVDFLEKIAGVEVTYGDFPTAFRKSDGTRVDFKPPTMHVRRRLGRVAPIQGPDFDFLRSATTRTPKVSIPSPSMLHFRGGRQAISEAAYPELASFYSELAAVYREEIADLAARGCRYLQLDDTNLAYLCDPRIRAKTAERGDDPSALTHTYCELINAAIRDRPTDMVVAIHLCRGNFKSAWVAEGSYEPVADILFHDLNVDAFFLEYDDERSGDFAPLRLMPRGKSVVLGLMSSKVAAAEDKEALVRRIHEAARYVPLEQCGLSHQCGFSSTAHGNELSASDQFRKLARCVEVAREVWGD